MVSYGDPLFLIQACAAACACLSLILLVIKVPFPEKFVWGVGVGIHALHAVLSTLYSTGSTYNMLFPILFWSQALQDTTGALALAIACYSFINKQRISAHWYSLPTGCSWLAMLSQYILPPHIKLGCICVTLVYILYANQSEVNFKQGRQLVVPLLLLVCSGVAELYASRTVIVPKILTGRSASFLMQAASLLILAFAVTGNTITGRKKIL
eukprot:TRINITY_DN16153_c0_g1_i2.p1 TRINITY_DN16153_c0_g1~~TRINITY_DN16153_c0_g1_i2.p1  ORF type:complete len:211 (-),score=8.00 TRINITY_DN16153_c0_g1_i2:46-678(-)